MKPYVYEGLASPSQGPIQRSSLLDGLDQFQRFLDRPCDYCLISDFDYRSLQQVRMFDNQVDHFVVRHIGRNVQLLEIRLILSQNI